MRKPAVIALLVLLRAGLAPAQSQQNVVTLNFDSVDTTASPYFAPATSYLAASGITVTSQTAGTQLIIANDRAYYIASTLAYQNSTEPSRAFHFSDAVWPQVGKCWFESLL